MFSSSFNQETIFQSFLTPATCSKSGTGVDFLVHAGGLDPTLYGYDEMYVCFFV